MLRPQNYFPAGINNYVPKMQMHADLANGVGVFSLGSPAAVDADILFNDFDADGTAGTITLPETGANTALDGTYGRNVRVTPSGDSGAAGSFDIYGWDYLGQPMTERISFVNGSTGIIYGNKIFKRLWKAVVVVAASNTITADVGTGYSVGLPYKGDVMWAKEAGAFVPLFKRDFIQYTYSSAAAVAGGPSGWFVIPPCPGYVKGLIGNPGMPVGSTTDPVITVELATVAVVGLTITLDTSDSAGLKATDAPTTAGYRTLNRFRKNDNIEIVVADADSGGVLQIGVELTPTQVVQGVTTDPQTTTTLDPRGSYESLQTADATELIVAMVGDPSYNSTGNGGLHGIRHV